MSSRQVLRRIGRWPGKLLAGLRAASEVRSRAGKGYVPQIREIIGVRFGPTRLYVGEYYQYHVFDDDLYPGPRKREVGGQRLRWRLSRAANDPSWICVARDKVAFHAVSTGLGLPVPALYAVFHPAGRLCGNVRVLRTPEEVADFLRTSRSYPVFGKPMGMSQGTGAVLIDGIDGARLLCGREREPHDPDRLVRERVLPFRDGFLFQEAVPPHPALLEICGSRLTSVRVTALSGPEGCRILRAAWRVPLGRSVTDNFEGGTTGNLRGELDPVSGAVTRAVRGMGPCAGGRRGPNAPIEEVHAHPETGAPLVGLRLPDWSRLVTLVRDAQASFPGLRWVGWDVALSARGPVLLECNHKPGLPQLPGSRGVYSEDVRRFLKGA